MSGSFISRGLELLEHTGLHELAHQADEVRRRMHPDGVVTFINDRNINYTNVCVSRCRFCAFHRAPGRNGGYVLAYEQVGEKIEEAKKLGAVQILLQGGLHPELPLSWYEGLLRYIKTHHSIHVHAFSAPEIDHLCALAGLSHGQVIGRLRDAGLDSIPGAGAEMLCARVRKAVSPNKVGVKKWLAIHETAHRMGIRTTATMVYGLGETMREVVIHFRHIRKLQEETGGFTAFIPWSFQPDNTRMPRLKTLPALYLRILAAGRVLLDNVPSVQASWVTQGPDIAQMALHFGANDFGSTMLEENVVRAAGCRFKVMDEQVISRLIRQSGFKPALRRQDYSVIRYL
ncbi:MAG: dehypoxanthine futalosine cyclase [Candidatus Glassbacteria bacterium]|nr:dehypoxanthine futalosine cyclase [Candidatus Glassbacteria bacterium]